EKFNSLVGILKRVGNISKDHNETQVNPELLKEEIEKELYSKSQEVAQIADSQLSNKEYTSYLNTILTTESVINKYFDSVMVMDKDEAIKSNRLSQLKFISEIFNRVGNLTLIEEK
ncbi:MAG: DALR anticodon-binding domain-containing protein, partial [Cetobacterium sp.]